MNARQLIEAEDPKSIFYQLPRPKLELNRETLLWMRRGDYASLMAWYTEFVRIHSREAFAQWLFPRQPPKFNEATEWFIAFVANWIEGLRAQAENRPELARVLLVNATAAYKQLPDYAKWQGKEFNP